MKRLTGLLLAATALTPATAMADSLTRVATVPLEAEITGLFLQGPDLFMNVQHPDAKLGNAFARATVGVFAKADIAAGEHPVPEGAAKDVVGASLGQYQILMQEGDFDTVSVIKIRAGATLFTSNDPDFNGFIPTGDNQGYLFTNWENRPGGMSRAKLTRAADGTWSVDKTDVKMLDFGAVNGTWVNCFGTVSPWATPLSSEELYFDDTAEWNNPGYKYHKDQGDLTAYLGRYPNPYDYGYIVEISDPAGAATPVKRFAMGRFSHEDAVVMPDNRTAYLSDDGTNVVIFKFVADKAGDLSAGTLYAAKATQQDAGNAADAATTGFDLEWIELAHGNEAEIAGWIRDYDGITPDDYVEGQTSYISDEDVAAWAAGKAADDRVAFLESRKAAQARGATAEFRKMEGVNINYDGLKAGTAPFMYMAMSEIAKGMADGEGDIRLGANKCGAVYELTLDGDYNATAMRPVIAGEGYDKDNAPNQCSTASVSNPDNLVVMQDGAVIVGEDTGKHENNMLWVWRKG